MSAHFFVTYRGLPVKFTFQAGKRIFELVALNQATPFCSEPDAWHAACLHQMSPEFVAVVNAQQRASGVASTLRSAATEDGPEVHTSVSSAGGTHGSTLKTEVA